jgi:hypothetical protein
VSILPTTKKNEKERKRTKKNEKERKRTKKNEKERKRTPYTLLVDIISIDNMKLIGYAVLYRVPCFCPQ